MSLDFGETRQIPLNEVTHSVRSSQAVMQYGPGAMIDFPDQTLMTAAPEYWSEAVRKIHDERLEKVLKVSYFGKPESNSGKKSIRYVRFPEWYFCPKCRKFQSIRDWVAEDRRKAGNMDDYKFMVRGMRCPTCRVQLVVERLVTVCEKGHIDDFPWVEWTHARSFPSARPICPNPHLEISTSRTSAEGLEGIVLKCSCGARATLSGAFDTDIFEKIDQKYPGKYHFTCAGRHPWKHTVEKCSEYPKVQQRSSASVYFPVITSSIVIPPYSSRLTASVDSCSKFEEAHKALGESLEEWREDGLSEERINAKIERRIEKAAAEIAPVIGAQYDDVVRILQRKWLLSDGAEEDASLGLAYKLEEYGALTGSVRIGALDGDFVREELSAGMYDVIPAIKQVALIHKVREVQALLGFTRLKPSETDEDGNGLRPIVPIREAQTDWLPANEVRGEGIFLCFDDRAINTWIENNPEVKHRAAMITENYGNSPFGESRKRTITPRYIMLHTLAHLLIRQLSFECGYGIASLKERIYCHDDRDQSMSGILIYTASGDSEGTLGGLVRQGRPDTLPGIFQKAILGALICSNDPVCSLSQGQGRDSLNLAACYSCTLLPETSCEAYNGFLDRGMVIGTCRNRNIGFFSSWIEQNAHGHQPSGSVRDERENPWVQTAGNTDGIVKDAGTSLADTSYDRIWNGLLGWSDTPEEKASLAALIDCSSRLAGKEKPYQNMKFCCSAEGEAYCADLYWPVAGVVLLAAGNEEAYEAAKKTNWQCFCLGDPEFDCESFISAIKEKRAWR